MRHISQQRHKGATREIAQERCDFKAQDDTLRARGQMEPHRVTGRGIDNFQSASLWEHIDQACDGWQPNVLDANAVMDTFAAAARA